MHRRRPPDGIILDMDSSESPTHGAAGGLGLERPLRLYLLPPAVRLQPVRRPRALRPAARQRPQRRRLAGRARAGDRPLPRARPRRSTSAATRRSPSPSSTSCWKRRGSATPSACRPTGPAGADRAPADAARRPAAEQAAGLLRQLQLPGAELDQAAPGGGQDGVDGPTGRCTTSWSWDLQRRSRPR